MPATSSPVILILGAGANIGQGVARTFASKGYRIALAARSLKEGDSTDTQLNITVDLSKPEDVVHVFTRVKKEFGTPSVVLYNASSLSPSPPNDAFAVPLEAFKKDQAINTTSAFVAAQQAVLGFADLPSDASRSFFCTGNILNVTALPGFLSGGVGKAASAHMMMAAADAYKDRGYKFYYVDERKLDGTAKYKVDGEAHGKLLWELAGGKSQGPWLQTFVKDVGYQSFNNGYQGN